MPVLFGSTAEPMNTVTGSITDGGDSYDFKFNKVEGGRG
jgi:hypothetical protein